MNNTALMHWVLYTDSTQAPRPAFRWSFSSPAEHPLTLGPVGWLVRRDGAGLAPPESALQMMESGEGISADDRDSMKRLAAEWRQRLAAGGARQADDADEESLQRFRDAHATQLASDLGFED